MAIRPLDDILREVIGMPYPDGKNHCYFEPPSNIKMNYPCIIYHISKALDDFADGLRYRSYNGYTVTVIDVNPDSKIPKKLRETLKYCQSDRSYTVDGLHHFVHDVYYNGPRIKEEKDE